MTHVAPHALWQTVAIQGNPGSYAHLAATQLCPQAQVAFYPTFAEALAAANTTAGAPHGAILPIENNTMGRVGDIHALLPHTHLQIVAELYLPIRHCLMAPKGATLAGLKTAHSQLPALQQCTQTLQGLHLQPVPEYDTAGAAKLVAEWADPTKAAVASELAASLYGLDILRAGVNDLANNTTRFIALMPDPALPNAGVACKTSLLFGVADKPGALVEALHGFSANGVNMTKLESYADNASFTLSHFYAETEGHPAEPGMAQALANLQKTATWVRLLGTYPIAEK